jgi:hypothetical protein
MGIRRSSHRNLRPIKYIPLRIDLVRKDMGLDPHGIPVVQLDHREVCNDNESTEIRTSQSISDSTDDS